VNSRQDAISDAVADDKSTIKKAKDNQLAERKEERGSFARYHCHEDL
jgi:hypothetical protein